MHSNTANNWFIAGHKFSSRKNLLCKFLFAAAVLLSSASIAAPKIEIQKPNRNEIYLGESLNFDVRVHQWNERMGVPDTATIKGAEVLLLGSNYSSHQYITIVNGRRRVTGFTGRTFTYQIRPLKEGRFPVGPISIKADNVLLKEGGFYIDVKPLESQDYVRISLLGSRDSVLVSEPFKITMQLDIKAVEEKAFRNRPPIHYSKPPHLTIPFLNLDPATTHGLVLPELNKILQPIVTGSRDPGFSINKFTLQRNPFGNPFSFNFDGMGNASLAKFNPLRKLVVINNTPYHRYSVGLTYIPKTEGSHTFGPIEFKGSIISGVENGAYAIFKEIFAIGPAVTIRVIPPPEENRPATFTGGVGSSLTVDARLDTETCNVGDPLTITLETTGNVSIENLRPPLLSQMTNLVENFRVYDDSVKSETLPRGKRYQYRIRPINPGTLEIPPIGVSYYNTTDRKYVTAYSAPIPVRANAIQQISSEDILGPDTNAVNSATISLNYAGENSNFAITISSEGAEPPEPLIGQNHLIALLAMPLLCLASWLGRFLFLLMPGTRRRRRHKQALPRARTQLTNLKKGKGNRELTDGSMLLNAVRNYITERFDNDSSSATPGDISAQLQKLNVPDDTVQEITKILELHFNQEFSGASDRIDTAKDASVVSDLLSQVEDSQRKPRKRVKTVSILPLLLLLPICQTLAAPGQEREFAWNEANARVGAARTPEEFLDAAHIYHKIERLGGGGAELFYNTAIALREAEQHDAAMRYLLRAERYSGKTPELRAALLATQRSLEDAPDASLPWYRVPLFWHYDIALHTRIWICIAFFNLLCLGFLLRIFNQRAPASILITVGLAGVVIFGSSALSSIHQERYDATIPLPILQEVSPPQD